MVCWRSSISGSRPCGAKYVVIDAVDALLHLYDNPMRERHELYALHEWLLDRGVTTIMTVKAVPQEEASSRYAFLDFMADCVIQVDQRVTAQITTRRLRVIKYRGSGYGRNEYPFIISEDGISIIPMTSNVLNHRPPGSRVSSGAAWLDDVLDGGYKRGTSILIAGTAGAGKTTLACVFARAACMRGERVLYLNFEESPESMVSNMLSPGVALAAADREGEAGDSILPAGGDGRGGAPVSFPDGHRASFRPPAWSWMRSRPADAWVPTRRRLNT